MYPWRRGSYNQKASLSRQERGNASLPLHITVVWISKLTSGELTLHAAIQWKTADGTNVTSRVVPEKAPDRTDSIHGRSFPGTAQSLPCISSSNSHRSYERYHNGKRMYNDSGFDSISRLSRLRQLLTFESAFRNCGHIVGNRYFVFCRSCQPHGAWAKVNCKISPDPGAPDIPVLLLWESSSSMVPWWPLEYGNYFWMYF